MSERPRYGSRKRFNKRFALIAVFVATLIWLAVNSSRMVERNVSVWVELSVPEGWVLQDPLPPRSVQMTVRGSRQIINNLQMEQLAIKVPLRIPENIDDQYTTSVHFRDAMITGMPPGASIGEISPASCNISLARLVNKFVSVEADISGKPDMGYTVGMVQVEPSAFEIRAPKRVIEKITPSDTIKTRVVDVTGQKVARYVQVALMPFSKDGFSIPVPGTVYVTVELPQIPGNRDMADPVPVRLLVSPPFKHLTDMVLAPQAVKVSVSGPEVVVSRLTSKDITVFVDTTDREPISKGEFWLKCRSLAPDGVEVIRIEPAKVKWIPASHEKRKVEKEPKPGAK